MLIGLINQPLQRNSLSEWPDAKLKFFSKSCPKILLFETMSKRAFKNRLIWSQCSLSKLPHVRSLVIANIFEKLKREWFNRANDWSWGRGGGHVVNLLPSNLTIWVRILLEPTVFSVNCILGKNENKPKRCRGWPI